MHACKCGCLLSQEESIRSPGTQVTSSCEIPGVVAGNKVGSSGGAVRNLSNCAYCMVALFFSLNGESHRKCKVSFSLYLNITNRLIDEFMVKGL